MNDFVVSLLARVKQGDRAAFDRLTEHCRERLRAAITPRIERVARSLDVEDVLQETFLRAFQSMERFQGRDGDDFVSWLVGIARHVIQKQSRRSSREQPLRIEDDPPASDTTPSTSLRRRERRRRFDAAIAGLKPEYREVLQLARLEGLKVKEIATRMHRTEFSVKHLIARALRELRASFGETESWHLSPRPGGSGGETHDRE
jgi:RNA polymerase sigma-70 factor, ECF subfamily